MGGVLARVLYSLFLAAVLAVSAWISFSRFVLGKSLQVPDLTNLSADEAATAAGERGLRVAVDRARADWDEKVAAQKVRGQSPAPGSAVKGGQVVRLFLSLGPHILRVPDLAGQTPRTAALALARGGLTEGVVSAARLAAGSGVVAQGIEPGTVASPGAAVDILLSRPLPDVSWVMPDLIGRDFERVRMAFESRGFRIGGVKTQVYEGAASGTILRQFPLPGFPVSLKDTLSFVVTEGEGGPR